ncbi:hypothetical protein GLOTRDRAFT_130743 [Gloeophyllum trabeum ATCC 11539]|uniref:RNA-dependent RNA polymerase n=1 Tax=Gloeophyllum trabeum (strain ATCC 11539 / FP-39264 / Madison 617) TaxID=670483 RepID=S7RL59_GLOTA|nr:uncharacterized protein GLOTRDRAFT_130743 [Gloeophyllum trabeum ATCC 11539]EPQ53404.1 hypothetical protein GLOTRDRAFT_130743 [Gloeophyllum trabeum ATCC 11539]
MADSLREEVAKLTKWDGPNAIMLLIDAIDKAGRVSGTKLQRLAGGMSRALGFSGRECREDAEEENPFNTFDDNGDDSFDAEFGFDTQSTPVSVHESAVELLKAGFHPLKLQLLWDKVKDILIRKIESEMLGYHINIAQSVEVFVVPDPFHILKEGEVYMRSNQGFEGMFTDTLEGPVLLSRNPTRVPSDVQKVTAVRCPQLADYSNLAVVSCKGKRSLASYLAGGDYDGDTVMVVWDQNFVRPFCNADLVVPEENFISENFHRDIEKVPDFLNRIARQRRSQCHSELLRVLLQGMADRKVGIYSMYHDITVHAYGLADARTVRLAHM